MRFFIVVSFILMVNACNQKDIQSGIDLANAGESYPPGAIITDYPDQEGLSKVTVKNGIKILAEGDYYQNKKHGAWTEYHDNQLVKSLETYFNGIKQGVSIRLSNNGEIIEKAFYKNGLLEGEFITYERRKVKSISNYSNGVLHGSKKSYYSNGNLLEESGYVNGKIDGLAKYYNQKGELLYEYTYQDGELVDQ